MIIYLARVDNYFSAAYWLFLLLKQESQPFLRIRNKQHRPIIKITVIL